MSAATMFPEIKNAALQTLLYDFVICTRSGNGTLYTGFIDRLGNAVIANSLVSGTIANTASQAGPGREVEVLLQTNPDGQTCSIKITPKSPAPLQGIVGQLDMAQFASHIS